MRGLHEQAPSEIGRPLSLARLNALSERTLNR
jgi:hypothetical protein